MSRQIVVVVRGNNADFDQALVHTALATGRCPMIIVLLTSGGGVDNPSDEAMLTWAFQMGMINGAQTHPIEIPNAAEGMVAVARWLEAMPGKGADCSIWGDWTENITLFQGLRFVRGSAYDHP